MLPPWAGWQCTLVLWLLSWKALSKVCVPCSEHLSSAILISEASFPIIIFSFSCELLIFSQKSMLIELLNQASFFSLKLLPFDNILIVTQASKQKIRNASLAHLPISSLLTVSGHCPGSPRFWEKQGDAAKKEETLLQLLHCSWKPPPSPPPPSSSSQKFIKKILSKRIWARHQEEIEIRAIHYFCSKDVLKLVGSC